MGKIAGISFLIPAESTVEIVQDLTLYYVMKGTAIVDIRGRDNIRMIEEDILAVNQSEECRVEVLEGITAAIEFSHEQIYSLLDGKNRYVECSSANVRTGSFNDLKEKVKKLISYLIQDESINVPDSIRQAAAKNGLQDMTLNEIISEIKPAESESDQQGEKLDYDKWRKRFLVEKYVDLGKALEDLSQKEAAKQIAEAEEDESQNIRDRLRDAEIDEKTIRELTSREQK
jgi:hypothetical protein